MQKINNIDRKQVNATPDRKANAHMNGNQTANGNFANSNNNFRTPNSIRTRNGTFHTLPICNTPTPPSRFKKIINPFEAALTDRLHLPLIGSPSLFHRPPTPQMCSTVLDFEWTIDEVSSLNPANVEAHETQFQSTVDPETEAKAQAAIHTFFKEQIIAPSPESCPYRGQKLLLSPPVQPSKGKRDGYCQTELTLPPILPKELEKALLPYFTYKMSQQQLPTMSDTEEDEIDHDARDASLRRKLFKAFNSGESSSPSEQDIDFDIGKLDSPAPNTPDLDLKMIRTRRFLTPINHNDSKSSLNISLSPVKREEFGCISPISSVNHSEKTENTDPNAESYKNSSSFYISTPEKSQLSLQSTEKMTIEFSSKRKSFHLSDFESRQSSFIRSSSESNEDFSYDDDMQMSQSSYGSQQHPHTPTTNKCKRQRRSIHRKNLSLSFNSCMNDENMSVIEYTEAMKINTMDKTIGPEPVHPFEFKFDTRAVP